MNIEAALFPTDLELVRALLREYAFEQAVDLCFQNFTAELESLPGAYAPPGGQLFLAREGAACAGCVALRPRGGGDAEMKRLFVRPAFRGLHIGRQLADTVLHEAAAAGYRRLLLDTLPTMTTAIAMYRRLGFVEIPPYRSNPVPGALFLARDLV